MNAAEHFKVFNKLFSDESLVEVKEARLIAVSVSAEIQIAAEIQRFSTLLYGNEFGIDKLNKII
ncbi:MAG: hypothetical protein CMD22_04275 [Flavobacteriales bacterium]|nr:hypothetical protein [Flavobacteriales bacterium]|tara:strand:- start:47 stop:238 length:192 start_codon:yes stop_codon:yes gene_type:complete